MDLTLLDVEAMLIACSKARAEFEGEEITDIDRIFDIIHNENFVNNITDIHFIVDNMIYMLLDDEPMIIEFEF